MWVCECVKGCIFFVYMEGGLNNLMGVWVFYIGFIFYCIYGIMELWMIGFVVLFGCIWMVNEDVIYFYKNVYVGVKIVVKC